LLQIVSDGPEAAGGGNAGRPDMLVLDLGLPGMDRAEVYAGGLSSAGPAR